MSYTALKKMREKNNGLYRTDIGPLEPHLYESAKNKNDLKSAALRFLHESCEGLKFDPGITQEEDTTGKYRGTSLKPGQIPYDMQMDINRLSLEKTLEQFIDSGSAEDAYLVYYCYLEIFLGHYGKSKKMIELLSEYESNGSSLLMKHRDHYSHSVYVFALGLAIYETNSAFRGKFRAFYQKCLRRLEKGAGDGEKLTERESDAQAACLFLEYWGLTSLFHDIGYPFELPFEQVMSYFEVNQQKRGKTRPYIAYRAIETLTTLGEEETERFRELYDRTFTSTTELFAFAITQKLGEAYGFTEEYMLDVLTDKPQAPDRFGYFMDHAFFSSLRLYRELVKSLKPGGIKRMHIDALTAILLHNSLYKFSISFYKDPPEKRREPLRAEQHPLAWLLMLCDELQCWDRTAYGRNSRTELHPMEAEFDFSGGALNAVYYYDSDEQEKIDAFEVEYKAWEKAGEKEEPPRLKAYSDMAEKEQRFRVDIEKIINTSDIPLTVVPDTQTVDRGSKHIFLSSSNFMHLYDFAVSLHGRSQPPEVTVGELEKQFETLSLEYQLSTINRAKYFSRYLDAIRCFYTDRPVDYEMVTEFTPEQAAVFAPMEHERWIRDHEMMGWRYGNLYEEIPVPDEVLQEPDPAQQAAETAGETDPARSGSEDPASGTGDSGINAPGMSAEEREELEKKAREKRKNAWITSKREQMRCHKLAMDGHPTSEEIRVHYQNLPEHYQDKDWKPFNSMLKLLKKFDGLRIYKLDDPGRRG